MIVLLILVIAALAVYSLLEYNNLTMLSETTKEDFMRMEEKMKARWEMVPKILDLSRIYLNGEKELIREIYQLTSNSFTSLIVSRKREVDLELTEKLDELIGKAERYPELEMNPKFGSRLAEFKKVDKELIDARIRYNDSAKELNKKVKGFPSSIIAKIFNYKEQVVFE